MAEDARGSAVRNLSLKVGYPTSKGMIMSSLMTAFNNSGGGGSRSKSLYW